MRTTCPRTQGSDPHDSLRRPAVRSPPRRLARGQLLRRAGPGARCRPRQPPIDQAAARRARAVEESRHDQHPAPRVGRGRRGRRHPRRSVPPEFANRAIRGGARDVAAGPIGVAVGGRVASGRQPDDIHLHPVRLFRRVPDPVGRCAGDRGVDRRRPTRTRRAMGRPLLRPQQHHVRRHRGTAAARGPDGRGVHDGLQGARRGTRLRPSRWTPGTMQRSEMHRRSAPSSSVADLPASS